jgi:hypothetical protein
MDVKEFVRIGLERARMATNRVMDGLTTDELKWQPAPDANSIGLILFHNARSEDNFVQARIQGKPSLWESQKWYQKFNLAIADTGSGYTAEQVNKFVLPDVKDLVAYTNAVRANTLEVVKNLPPAEFDKVLSLPRLGDISIGGIFALILVHVSQHAGEISYLRGLKRGMNK